MSIYTEKANDFRLAGYSCSQSVAMAFADVINELDETEISKLASPFGGGFARQASLCGCVSGMGIIWGLLFGDEDPQKKAEVYNEASKLSDAFVERFGSVDCRDLWPDYKGDDFRPLPEGYERQRCNEYVKGAVEILEAYLTEKGIL